MDLPHRDLSDVFIKAGEPSVTFVETENFESLKSVLTLEGQNVIIEGPSGIGKTTAVLKATEEIQTTFSKPGSAETTITMLSTCSSAEQERLKTLENWHEGVVIIDNFHRLDVSLRLQIAEYLKLLAYTNPKAKKLVIVGIPQSGQALIDLPHDLETRIKVFRWGKVEEGLVLQMIKKGEHALNIKLDSKAELAKVVGGSLNLAQFLCFYICQQEGVWTTQEQERTIYCQVKAVLSSVEKDLLRKFGKATKLFAALDGPYDVTCLSLLKEMSRCEDGRLSLAPLKERRPELADGIKRFINEEWMNRLYREHPDSRNYISFDQSMFTLVIDDPQFTFYLKHISFPVLAREVGKVVTTRHKVFLCYCEHRIDGKWLRRLQIHLKPLEHRGTIDTWDMTKITVGAQWERELRTAIETAKVAVLLVSADFLASDLIRNHQLPKLLSRAQAGGTTIMSLVVAPCLFEGSELDVFLSANSPDRPLVLMTGAKAEQTLTNLAKAIREKLAEEEP